MNWQNIMLYVSLRVIQRRLAFKAIDWSKDLVCPEGGVKDSDVMPGPGRSPEAGNGSPGPTAEEPGGLQSTGSHRAGHN